METLESIFRKQLRHYEVYLNDSPAISMIIGDHHIFTTGVTIGNPYDPENACIEVFERNGALFINSYYDEPGTTCTVIDHTLMFRVLKVMAKHMGFTRIVLLDGSRKRTGTGCEWDLRILNRLYKGGPTFYEKHGFVPLSDPLNRPIRLETILHDLHPVYQAYLVENHITSMEALAVHMHTLCNRKDFLSATIKDIPLQIFYNGLSKEIKHVITASKKITEEDAMTYFFDIPPFHSTCHLKRPVSTVKDKIDPVHGTGVIRFTVDPTSVDLLDKSYKGGRRRRTKRRKN